MATDVDVGLTPYTTPDGQRVTDITGWPTRAEVAERLGVSVQRVRTLERKGQLHPQVDREGTHRFFPAEVDAFVAGHDTSERTQILPDADAEERSNAVVSFELQMAKRLLTVMLEPREVGNARLGRLDEMTDRLITRLERRVVYLEEENDKLRSKLAAATESQMADSKALAIVEGQEARKTEAFMRLLTNVERWVNKGTPFLDSLSEDQLSLLSVARDDLGLSEGQTKAIAEALARKHPATSPKTGQTNGQTTKGN